MNKLNFCEGKAPRVHPRLNVTPEVVREGEVRDEQALSEFVSCRLVTDEEGNYNALLIDHPTVFIEARYDDYRKKWYFLLSDSYRYVRNHWRETKIEKPNEVHKLTEAGIRRWVDYLEKVNEEMAQLSIERVAKVGAFLSSIPEQAKHNQGRMDGFGAVDGWVTLGEFELKYTINSDGWIGQQWSRMPSPTMENLVKFGTVK